MSSPLYIAANSRTGRCAAVTFYSVVRSFMVRLIIKYAPAISGASDLSGCLFHGCYTP